MRDRQAIIAWARGMFQRDNWVILDTETTGLEADAEIVELSVAERQRALRKQ